MEQANVKVSFYLKKSEADAEGMCPVMARLNIGKYSEAAFSVKLRVPQSMWSSGRASGKSVKAKEINNRLDEIRAMALGVYAELSAVRDGVTTGDIKSLLLGMAGEQTTLLSYFRTFTGYEPVRPKQKRRYLTSEELQRLMTTPLHRLNLYLTRDLFPFSCYTGIPYSDMRLLSKEHLSLADDGTWWIISSRRKPESSLEFHCWTCRYISWRNTGTRHRTAGCCPCIPTAR